MKRFVSTIILSTMITSNITTSSLALTDENMNNEPVKESQIQTEPLEANDLESETDSIIVNHTENTIDSIVTNATEQTIEETTKDLQDTVTEQTTLNGLIGTEESTLVDTSTNEKSTDEPVEETTYNTLLEQTNGLYGDSNIELVADDSIVSYICDNDEGKYQLIIDCNYVWTNGNGNKYAQVRNIQPLTEAGYTAQDEGIVRIPQTIKGSNGNEIPIVSIKKSAFEGCGAKEIIVPDQVHEIEDNAFKGCALLEKVSILGTINPGNKLNMNKQVPITDVTIRDTDVIIANTSNSSGSSTTVKTLKSTIMGDSVFSECTNLKEVNINGFTQIGKDLFNGCTSLTDVIISLNDCFSITYTDKGDIRDKAGCEDIEKTVVGINAFTNCTSLKKLDFSKMSVSTLGKNAFLNCTLLETIILSPILGSNNINRVTFTGCDNLKEFISPENTKVSEYDENGNPKYTEVSPLLIANDGVLYKASSSGKDAEELLYYPPKREETILTIPNKCKKIADNAVTGVSTIKKLVVPSLGLGDKDYLVIGKEAFRGSGLEEVVLNFRVEMKDSAMADCSKLSIFEPGDVIKVGKYALSNLRALEEIHFDKAEILSYGLSGNNNLKVVTGNIFGNIGDYAFTNDTSLMEIDISRIGAMDEEDEKKKHSVGTYVFKDCTSLTKVIMPAITGIPTGMFSGCSLLNNLEAQSHSSVSTIGSLAFENCTSLKEIPEFRFLVKVDDLAFKGCSNIRVPLTRSVVKISEKSLAECDNLIVITSNNSDVYRLANEGYGQWNITIEEVPDTLTDADFLLYDTGKRTITGYRGGFHKLTIPDRFKGYYIDDDWIHHSALELADGGSSCNMLNELKEIDFGQVKSIGKEDGKSFSGCKALEKVTIHSDTIDLFKNTFNNCTSLKDVTIEDGLRHIGSNAFQGCKALVSITLPSTLDETIHIDEDGKETIRDAIENNAFNNCISLKEVKFTEPDKTVSKKVVFGNNSFSNTGLTGIEFPYYTHTVKSNAFSMCRQLENIRFSPKTLDIETDAFKNCTKLRDVTVEKAMFIDDYAFRGCRNIENIVIPPSANFASRTGQLLAFSDIDKEIVVIICANDGGVDKIVKDLGFNTEYVEFDERYEYTTVKLKIQYPDSIVVYRGDEELKSGSDVYTYDKLDIQFVKPVDVYNYNVFINKEQISLPAEYTVDGISSIDISVVEKEPLDPSQVKAGDINTNGVVDVGDASLILQYVLDKSVLPNIPITKIIEDYKPYMDVNNDGVITALDASMVLAKSLNSSFEFPIGQKDR